MQFFKFLRDDKPALIEKSMTDFGVMLDTAGEMFAASTAYLLDNESLSLDLSTHDEKINRLEQDIRRAVLEHLAVDPQDEMPLSLLLVSIVQDAERCGDLTKSIAKAADLADAPRMGPYTERLRGIRDRVQHLFPRVIDAFQAGDEDVGREVMEENDLLKVEVADLLGRLAAADDLTVNQAVVLAIASRMIGRISSHLSNIISAVTLPFDKIRRSPTWGDDE